MAVTMKTLLQRIVNNRYCLGCGLCASLAGRGVVDMAESSAGFSVPRLISRRADLAFLKRTCPGIRLEQPPPRGGVEQTLYGPFQSLHAAHAADDEVRWKASSGGAITGLLLHLLEQGVADAVLQVGCVENSPLRSAARLSRTRADVIRCAGSRYAPASLLADWADIMRSGERIAVVGKPCDIAAVRNALRLHPEWEERVVCLVSFLCMGMPSQRGTGQLIRDMGLPETELRDFWYRGNGWPGRATAVTQAGERRDCSYEDSWGNILSRHVHFRCKVCPDGFGGQADISCGDAWRLRNGKPSFAEEPGRSLLFVRTPRGAALFGQAVRQGSLVAEPFPVEDLKTIQPSQYQRRIHVGARLAALKLLGDRLLVFSGFRMLALLRLTRFRLAAWNFWGMVQRRLNWKGPVKV